MLSFKEKEMKKLLVLSLLVIWASPAMAGTITTPYVAGAFQGWDAAANPMTETGVGTDIWTATFTGLTADTRYEFKITDGTWGLALPSANSWCYSDASGEITISYDGNTYTDGWSPTFDRIGVNVDPGAWTAVGDWQTQAGGTDWTNNDPVTAMAAMGGGVYSLTTTLAPGTYNWKAVNTGSWDSISWDGRSINTANWEFTTDAANNVVTFDVNALAGIARVTVTPEPASLVLLALGGLALLRRR